MLRGPRMRQVAVVGAPVVGPHVAAQLPAHRRRRPPQPGGDRPDPLPLPVQRRDPPPLPQRQVPSRANVLGQPAWRQAAVFRSPPVSRLTADPHFLARLNRAKPGQDQLPGPPPESRPRSTLVRMSEGSLSFDAEVADHQVIFRAGRVEAVAVPLEEYRALKALEKREAELYWVAHESR